MGWVETVAIIVAPQKPIYDIHGLNEFMEGLGQDVKPSNADKASQYDREGGIHLGRLYFDEVLGTQTEETKTVVTALQPDVLQRAGIAAGESFGTRKRELKRRTWVRPYPDAVVARIVADYEVGVSEGTIEPDQTFEYLEHWIYKEQLNKLKRRENPFRKIAGLLK